MRARCTPRRRAYVYVHISLRAKIVAIVRCCAPVEECVLCIAFFVVRRSLSEIHADVMFCVRLKRCDHSPALRAQSGASSAVHEMVWHALSITKNGELRVQGMFFVRSPSPLHLSPIRLQSAPALSTIIYVVCCALNGGIGAVCVCANGAVNLNLSVRPRSCVATSVSYLKRNMFRRGSTSNRRKRRSGVIIW